MPCEWYDSTITEARLAAHVESRTCYAISNSEPIMSSAPTAHDRASDYIGTHIVVKRHDRAAGYRENLLEISVVKSRQAR